MEPEKPLCSNALPDSKKYDGEIVSDIQPLKNSLGFLPTVPYFFSKITGKEYIRLVCNARKIKINNIEDKNIFDLPLNQYASLYSSGMRKKVGFNSHSVATKPGFYFRRTF
jgi:ABC-2 type transport system ATP-binding protein